MSQENVETVNTFYTGDLEQMSALIHPDAVFSEAVGLPYSGDYVGPQGFRDLMKKIRDGYKLEVEGRWQTIDAGEDRVLLLMEPRFTSRRSGAQATIRLSELYRVNDGLITGNDIFYKDPARIAGLHDQTPVA
jgi:hypothetical protein